jgi:hypothetical protein
MWVLFQQEMLLILPKLKQYIPPTRTSCSYTFTSQSPPLVLEMLECLTIPDLEPLLSPYL